MHKRTNNEQHGNYHSFLTLCFEKKWTTDTFCFFKKNNLKDNICNEIRIGATIIIAYAYVGNSYEPQSKIIYLAYDWIKKSEVKFKVIN